MEQGRLWEEARFIWKWKRKLENEERGWRRQINGDIYAQIEEGQGENNWDTSTQHALFSVKRKLGHPSTAEYKKIMGGIEGLRKG